MPPTMSPSNVMLYALCTLTSLAPTPTSKFKCRTITMLVFDYSGSFQTTNTNWVKIKWASTAHLPFTSQTLTYIHVKIFHLKVNIPNTTICRDSELIKLTRQATFACK